MGGETVKIHTKIRFAHDMIAEDFWNFILSVILSGIALALFGFTLMVFIGGGNGKRSAENVLSEGIEHTGLIVLEEQSGKEAMKFRREAFSSETVKSIGAYEMWTMDKNAFASLYSIQNGRSVNSGQGSMFSDGFQMLTVDKELLSLCRLELEKGTLPEKLDYTQKDTEYIYLGSAYSGIPVGTEFVDDGAGLVYRVAGILDRDSRFAMEDLKYDENYSSLRNDMDMEYEAIHINNGISYSMPWLFSAERSCTFADAEETLYRLAEKNGVKIRVYPLQSLFEKVEEENRVMQDSLVEMIILVLLVIAAVSAVLQVVQIMRQERFYGIMYAVGFLKPEIQSIMVVRNIVWLLLSLGFGGGMILFGLPRYFVTHNIQVRGLFYQFLAWPVLPVCVCLSLVVFAVITVVPCTVFGRQDPVKLIQGE